jgi:hypothetical protein
MTVAIGAFGLMTLAAAGPAGSTRALASFLAVLALLAATVRVARGNAPGRGRPVIGLLLGLLSGVAGAVGLLAIGAIAASSPLWVYLPLVGATLATLLGGSVTRPVVEDTAVVPLSAATHERRCPPRSGATDGLRDRRRPAPSAPTGS